MKSDVLIIGAGPAGVRVAETLREFDFRGSITMLTREPFPPYSPPLLADFLESHGSSELIFWKGKDVCQRLDLNCLTGAEVAGLDPSSKRVHLRDGRELTYERLVIASGSRIYIPIRCECPRANGRPTYYNFKSLEAVSDLLERVGKGAERVVIIGAGFIGMEIAITLRRIGLPVLVVEMMDRILPRMTTKDIAEPLETIVRDMGIELMLGEKGTLLRGRETAEELDLESGKTVRGELFVAATGVKPNIAFLEGSGIRLGRGVSVDNRLRTSVPDVYACGDVAEVPDLITGNVYPHAIYPEAVKQGEVVALNLLGIDVRYEGALNMNSLYHFGLPLISEGAMITEQEPEEELTYRKGQTIRKIALQDGKILRFELIGEKKGSGLLHTLMTLKRDVSAFKEQLVMGTYNQAHHLTAFPTA